MASKKYDKSRVRMVALVSLMVSIMSLSIVVIRMIERWNNL